MAHYPPPRGVDTEDVVIPTSDGSNITIRLYRARHSAQTAVLLYLHGGGMIMCGLETHDGVCRDYAASTGLAVMAVDYRLAPQNPFPTPFDDCMDALRWLASEGAARGLDPTRIVVGGESAGGGLAAAVALRARDEGGPALAGQVLVYPMLGDRTYVQDPELEAVALWSYDDHVTAWEAYRGPTSVDSAYATPLRADELTGLPPTYLECGELDIFRAENKRYAARLLQAGVRLELHLRSAVPHAFVLYNLMQPKPAENFLSRVTVTLAPDGTPTIDPASEQNLLRWPSDGHNGGEIAFGSHD